MRCDGSPPGLRAHVEGIVANLRSPSTQNIRRGFCRVTGLIKTTLMLAFEVSGQPTPGARVGCARARTLTRSTSPSPRTWASRRSTLRATSGPRRPTTPAHRAASATSLHPRDPREGTRRAGLSRPVGRSRRHVALPIGMLARLFPLPESESGLLAPRRDFRHPIGPTFVKTPWRRRWDLNPR